MTQHTEVLVLKNACWTQIDSRCSLKLAFSSSRTQPSDLFAFPSTTDSLNVWHIQSNSTHGHGENNEAVAPSQRNGKRPCADAVIFDLVKGHRCGRTHPAPTTCWIFPLTKDMRNFKWTTAGKTEKVGQKPGDDDHTTFALVIKIS